jgi:hypothetical protein
VASLASATDQLSQLSGPAMGLLSNALASDNPPLGALRSFLSRAMPEEADPAKGISHRRNLALPCLATLYSLSCCKEVLLCAV